MARRLARGPKKVRNMSEQFYFNRVTGEIDTIAGFKADFEGRNYESWEDFESELTETKQTEVRRFLNPFID